MARLPHKTRQMVAAVQRDELDGVWRCRYCRVELMRPDVRPLVWDGKPYPERDHVIPVSRGGLGDLSNVAVACQGCNVRKGGLLVGELPRGWPSWRSVSELAVR